MGFGNFIIFSLHPDFVLRDAEPVGVCAPRRYGLAVQPDVGVGDLQRPV